MPATREFLGWSQPCLPLATAWLRDRYAHAGRWDLSNLLIVTTGGRAKRRLLELLANHAAGLALLPPQTITLGELPERLYSPAARVADPLTTLLARVASLKQADVEVLKTIAPRPPQSDDLPALVTLAQELNRLHDQLAADMLRVGDVNDRCANLPDFPEAERWDALAQLQAEYEQVLSDLDLIDTHAARFAAVDEHQCRADRTVILLGIPELTGIARQMLAQLADPVIALIHAPADRADDFDDLGCVIPQRWTDRPLDVPTQLITVVDRPRDQGTAVLRAIAEAQSQRPTPLPPREGLGEGGAPSNPRHDSGPTQTNAPALDLSPDDITIGLGDETIAPAVSRALRLTQLPVRLATSSPLTRTRPALMLAALARFAQRQRFDAFASLLRHPDIEDYVNHHQPQQPLDLTTLDRYAARHLQDEIAQRWLTDEPPIHATLDQLYAALSELLPADHAAARPLPLWSQPIADALLKIYNHRRLARHRDEDLGVIQSLEALADSLRDQSATDARSSVTPRVTFAQAVQFTLTRLADRAAAPPGGTSAIEMLGWLELHMDDAPVLLITGVNEGHIPAALGADPFLPDTLRRHLGLPSNLTRYARDRMMLEAILESRRTAGYLRLIAGRRSADNNPLAPSRLLLACDDAQLPARVKHFYDAAHADTVAPLLLQPGPASRFILPVPMPANPPLPYLRVTDFDLYRACPYRFYLERVLRLESLDDRAVELDALAFGVLVHDCLNQFGKSDLRNSANTADIAAFLSTTLDDQTRRLFGKNPRIAIQLQREVLRRRLAALARWQATQRAEGWRIHLVEQDARVDFDVDAIPMPIRGRIDRVDIHDSLGYRIIDFKAGDSPVLPHKQAADRLQLPLYHVLAPALGITGSVQLGYVNLSKKVDDVAFAAAKWDATQLAEAIEVARDVVRKIRSHIFYPPAEPARYPDGYEGLCMDDCMDRPQAIEAMMQSLRKREASS